MLTNKFLLFIIVFIFSIISCTSLTNTAGVTDIPNEKIAGMVMYKNNSHLANVAVILRKIMLTSTGDSIVEERKSETDILGSYSFDTVKNGTYVIFSYDSISGKSAIISKLQKQSDLVLQNLYLDNNITIKGRIITNLTDAKPITVFIPGINKQAQIDSNGYYQLEDLPNGQYDLGFIYNNTLNFLSIKTTGNSDTVFIRDVNLNSNPGRVYNFFDSKSDSVFSVDPLIYEQNPDWYTGKDFYAASYYTIENNSLVEIDENGKTALLIDNFNDNDDFTELYTVFPEMMWYGWDDAQNGGLSVLIPNYGPDSSFTKYIVPYEGMGKVVHIQFAYGNTIGGPRAGIGCKSHLLNKKYYINLSKMTALSFYIRGKGSISVGLTSKKVYDYPAGNNWGHMQKTITLPSQWQHVTIPVSELVPPSGTQQQIDGLTWQDVRDSIKAIHFSSALSATAGDTIDLWLDNIYLHGVGDFNLK
jgi:hypothetical protein